MINPGDQPKHVSADLPEHIPISPIPQEFGDSFKEGAGFMAQLFAEAIVLRRQNSELRRSLEETTSSLQEIRSELMQVNQDNNRLYTLAYQDPLTGKPNRRALTEHLQDEVELQPGKVGVFFVDLDGLKEVNDNQGHAAGDELIKSGISILDENLRTQKPTEEAIILEDSRKQPDVSDIISRGAYRLSGDEGVGLVTGIDSEEDLAAIASRLRGAYERGGVKASIGYVLHTEGQTASDVVVRADEAMFEVKTQRRELRQAEQRQALSPEVQTRAYELVLEADELGIGVDGLFRYFGTKSR